MQQVLSSKQNETGWGVVHTSTILTKCALINNVLCVSSVYKLFMDKQYVPNQSRTLKNLKAKEVIYSMDIKSDFSYWQFTFNFAFLAMVEKSEFFKNKI